MCRHRSRSAILSRRRLAFRRISFNGVPLLVAYQPGSPNKLQVLQISGGSHPGSRSCSRIATSVGWLKTESGSPSNKIAVRTLQHHIRAQHIAMFAQSIAG